ncbi:probable LRR receptor-like serine/threonine-protein kinase At3g47570 [Hordeum vulgare subsp. vulgare]|nr:probable LRR receptor-like serine/threonine-protein kinase At3g47570 [Hordeum vulgare subsp. vulgare]
MTSSGILFPGIIWFLCLFSFICSLPLAVCNETKNDRQALLCFKSQLTGPAGVLASWSNTSLDVCEWHGITCSIVSPRRVIVLDLESQGISGSISPCVANLTSLTRLQLSNNGFIGGIPSELGLLSQLRDLNLSKNTLEGNIPSSLGSIRSLTYVDLGVNALTGFIPESLANSSSLQVLSLMRNNLTGNLPKVLFNTSSLIKIFLQQNNLVGSIPAVIATSPPIEYLDLRHNHISGKIPSSIGKLSSLVDLRITENNLVGSIPDSLGNISTLKILTLTGNKLSGTVPPSLFTMSSLTFLGLANNSLVGRLPSNIGYTLPNIQGLILSSNKFDGPIPASLPRAYNLRQLYLYNNSLTGFIPFFGSLPNLTELGLSYNQLEAGNWGFVSSLANCTRLTKLMLNGNSLQGKVPSSIGNLSDSLEWLWLRENQISGPIPPEIGNLKSLNRLYMDYNLITGNIPPTIGNLHSLVHLSLAHNKLSGQIPDTIGDLVKLNSLKLDGNNISGRIPESIGRCTQLQILNLAHNSLEGNIPSEIIKISSLSEELDLSHNYLSGGIPVEVGNLINVNKISISNNRLSGNIPSTLGQCVVLEYLDISRNKLSGKIPQFLTSLSSLQNLNLSFNNFGGEVPRGGIFYNASAVSIEGNDDLCTSIPTGGIPLCSMLVERKGKQNSSALILRIVIPTVAAVILILSCIATIYWRKRMQANPHLQEIGEHMRKISYKDIVRSTNSFSQANLIGSGSFGVVYKGSLKLQKDQVAIKIFNLNNYGANRSFIAECEALRNVRHRNLVKIITSCSSVDSTGADFKALVFQYMPNGNLEMWLHPEDLEHGERHILTLSQRINIGLDVAFALDYLHNQCASPLIHCDLKPSNILLDVDMVAYVTDFGLARFVFTPTNADSSTSLACLKGSIGYIPPEYGMSKEISTKGDVYSFGVLLLQMITGQSPTDGKFSDGASLHEFVRRAFPDNICGVVDPALLQDDRNTPEVMEKCVIPMVRIGLSCSMTSPKDRPDMGQVSAEILRIKHLASHMDVR